jgi:hypothetical protein
MIILLYFVGFWISFEWEELGCLIDDFFHHIFGENASYLYHCGLTATRS